MPLGHSCQGKPYCHLHCEEGVNTPLNPYGSLASLPSALLPGGVAGKAAWSISLILWAAPFAGGALHPRHPSKEVLCTQGMECRTRPPC